MCEVNRRVSRWWAPSAPSTRRVQKWLAPWNLLMIASFVAQVASADVPPPMSMPGQTNPASRLYLAEVPRRPGWTIDSQTPVVLPQRGGNAGMPFALTCGPDELVVGVRGRMGMTVETLGLSCARVRPNGTLDMPEQRPILGTSSGEPYSMQCGRHEAILGLRGRAATGVDRLGLSCARVRPWFEQGRRGSVLPSVGGTLGIPFTDECPRGYLLHGILGYSNTIINAIQGLCVPIVNGP